MTPFELEPGVTIGGKYRLVRLLGEGGMGSVWVAYHEALSAQVAMKFIGTEHMGRADLRERFEREAKASARIQSAHVARTYDHGFDEAGRPYLVMELLDGEDLASRLAREPQLRFDVIAKILGDVCRGLGKAHAAGIVHRDIKPENLFLCAEEDGFTVKILDFGIARDLGAQREAFRTGTGAILGTPAYMSPEQARGRGDVGVAADLYSIAVVVYRAVTGMVPFEREGGGELIMAIMTEPPPPAASFRPAVGPSLSAWFDRALAKEASARFPSARELAAAFVDACIADGVEGSFVRLAGSSGAEARVSGSIPRVVTASARSEAPTVATPHPAAPVGTLSGAATPPARPPKSRAVPLIFGVVGLAAVATLAWAFVRPGPRDVGPAPTASPARPADAPAAPPSADTSPQVSVRPVEPPPPPAASSSARPSPKVPAPPRASAGPARPKGTDWGI